VSTIAPSPLNPALIWAGSNTGLIHLTRDGGKSWKDVSPPGLSDWSEVSLIEASHYEAAVAYAAIDRSRLDDQKPYLYRTRDYGATWQPITAGIASTAFLRAIREDPHSRGLLFAGTEFGIYVSLDDGEYWQPLQLNLPVTSVRDLTIHGDDLVIATHGRSFWILDNITPLRQASEAVKAPRSVWLFHPAAAIRVDNDTFVGTPLPPEEPTAENPPTGAVIDYFLKSPAGSVKLEIFDAQHKLVRSFSSEDKNRGKHAPLPVADRWLPKPEALEKAVGMHRFVWNLAWGSSGGPIADEETEFRNPSGPKVVPGTYDVRLTVDGQSQSQSLEVLMDPRSPATSKILAQQFQLGQQIFDATLQARRVLAEIRSVQKQLTGAEERASTDQNAALKATLAEAQSGLSKLLRNKEDQQKLGIEDAYKNLASALRVVEGGDRAAPSQAIAVYRESSEQIGARMSEWTAFKQKKLLELNEQLRQSNLTPIAIADIEEEVEFLMSQ
jgi:hypothetical protein